MGWSGLGTSDAGFGIGIWDCSGLRRKDLGIRASRFWFRISKAAPGKTGSFQLKIRKPQFLVGGLVRV